MVDRQEDSYLSTPDPWAVLVALALIPLAATYASVAVGERSLGVAAALATLFFAAMLVMVGYLDLD